MGNPVELAVAVLGMQVLLGTGALFVATAVLHVTTVALMATLLRGQLGTLGRAVGGAWVGFAGVSVVVAALLLPFWILVGVGANTALSLTWGNSQGIDPTTGRPYRYDFNAVLLTGGMLFGFASLWILVSGVPSLLLGIASLVLGAVAP